MVSGKSGPTRARLAVPPRTTRSSCSSTRLSSRADRTACTAARFSTVKRSGSPARRPAASASRWPTVAALSCARSSKSRSSGTSVAVSTTRCSTRPVVVMSTTSSRVARQRHQLDVAHARPRQRGVLDDSHLLGQLGEQPHRPGDDVVEVHRPVQEGLDGPALGGRERLDASRAGRRRAGSPCRSGSGRRWCAAGRCSPRPRARPCRCGSWPARRPGCAARRAPSSPPAPASTRSPRRWRAARRACGPRARTPPARRSPVGQPVRAATLALWRPECQCTTSGPAGAAP